jgi:hypothetical protein
MSVSDKTPEVVKTSLGWVQGQDVDAFLTALNADPNLAMTFAERRLKRDPQQHALFKAYVSNLKREELPRARAFLASGLEVRPVHVPWHRVYQSLAEADVPEGELIAQYDRYLAAEPQNAALLYLRGRIDPDEAKAKEYYERAAKLDENLAWPWVGLAAQAVSWARWDEALAALKKAKALPLDDTELLEDLDHAARLGTKQARALIDQYRTVLDSQPMNGATLVHLLDALAIAGEASEIDPTITKWEGRLPDEFRSQIGPHIRALGLYQAGKVRECEELCRDTDLLQRAPARTYALMAAGKAREAAADAGLAPALEDSWNALALSLALSLEGDPKEAARWRERAAEKCGQPRLAKALTAESPPAIESLPPMRLSHKALVLAALAARFSAKQDDYLALAAKLNVSRSPPYLIVKRAVERKFGGRP